jgi:hypothetical protein
LTDAQIARAHEVADFMRAHGFGDEREFVEVEVDGVTFIIVDIGMRMLTPRELFNACGTGRRRNDGSAFRHRPACRYPRQFPSHCAGEMVARL